MSADAEITIDDQVDALIAGERTHLEPRDQADAVRAAGLLVIHGLLTQQAQGAALHNERILRQALDSVRRMRVIVRRSLGPLLTAAMLGLGFMGWWTVTKEHRAAASIAGVHHSQGPRRYNLTVERKADTEELRQIRGTYDVDGNGCCVMTIPMPASPEGNRVVMGRNRTEWWIIPPMGGIQRGPNRDVVMKWIRAVAADAPFPSLDDMLENIERDYDLAVTHGEDGMDTYYARRTADNPAMASLFLLVVDTRKGRVDRVRWEWESPCGSIAQLIAVEGQLVDPRVFPDGWFDPNSHVDSANDLGVEPEQKPSR